MNFKEFENVSEEVGLDKVAIEILDTLHAGVFSVEIQHLMETFEIGLNEIDSKFMENMPDSANVVFESLFKFCRGFNGIATTEVSFEEARELFASAAEGYEKLHFNHLQNLCLSLLGYCDGIIETRRLNLPLSVELFQSGENAMAKSGEFADIFSSVIDRIKPEALFISSLPALQNLDLESAEKILLEASKKSNEVAKKHFPDDCPEKSLFEGFAYFYRSFYKFFYSFNKLQQYEMATIVSDTELVEVSQKARDVLSEIRDVSDNVQVVADLSASISLLSQVIQQLAGLVQKSFSSIDALDLAVLPEMKDKVRMATEFAATTGPQSEVFIRFCTQITNQLNNYETMSKLR